VCVCVCVCVCVLTFTLKSPVFNRTIFRKITILNKRKYFFSNLTLFADNYSMLLIVYHNTVPSANVQEQKVEYLCLEAGMANIGFAWCQVSFKRCLPIRSSDSFSITNLPL
jgi:hypothetical protein